MKQLLIPVLNCTLLALLPVALRAHGIGSSDQHLLSEGGLLAYVYVGAKHMVTGYDHLLFLVGVVFYLRGYRDIIRFITAFTVGHSITLMGATYLGVTADEHLIDGLIAVSVLYKGFENLGGFKRIFHTTSPNLLRMVFLFGLIHGFGLSTRLQSLPLGVEQFLAKIVCFNIGVEIGQVLALVPILFVISLWKGKAGYTTFYTVVNWGLMVAGVALLLFQIYAHFHQVWYHQ